MAFSALLGGIGDSIHGAELMERVPKYLDGELVALIGTGSFMRDLLPKVKAKGLVIDDMPVKGAFSRLKFEWRTYRRIRKMEDLDAVYLRFRSFALGPLLAVKKRKVPLYVEINGFPSLEYKGSGLLKRLTFNIDRKLLKRATKIVLLYEVHRKGLTDYYGIDEPERIVFIPNGTNTDRFKPIDRDVCREMLGLPDGKIVVFIGAVEPWQGISNLIEAFHSLKVKHDDLKLVVVGGGSILKELMVHKDVIFTGSVPYTDVPAYTNAADLCAVPIPTDRLAFPMKVLETLACGVPLLVTENVSTAELKDVTPEFLMPDNDPRTIERKVEELVYGMDALPIAERGKDYVVKRYTWDSTAEMVASLLTRGRIAK